MHHDLEQIRALCKRHKTWRKILLIPRIRMKAQILKVLTDNGIYPLNLVVMTVGELAYHIAESSIRANNLTLIDFKDVADVMADLLKKLQTKGVLCFFNKIEITSGICRAVAKTVLELLNNGYSHGYVKLDHIKNANKRTDLEAIITEYDSLKSIVSTYNRVYSAFDSQGLTATFHELNTSIKGRRVNLNEAVEIIKNNMKDINILSESPMAGKIHFTTYDQAAWIDRENVFVIGLGADKFPGMAVEDPLLLDSERTVPPMMTSLDRINRAIDNMNMLIENISGKVTFSYSCFDTIDLRECFPATLFYRLKEMFPDEKVNHVDFVLEDENRFIDENDYWTYHGVKSGAVTNEDNVPHEQPDAPMWQPGEQIPELELTATSLVTYLECKYKYFLKHILSLREIKPQEFDALGWLSALETGNLYHAIFEEFISDVIKNPCVLQDKAAAISRIHEITEKKIEAFEDELPTASSFQTARQL